MTNKEMEKYLTRCLKGEIKKRDKKFKTIDGIFWREEQGFLIKWIPGIYKEKTKLKIYADLRIKLVIYDDIIWDIMRIQSNKKERYSLRVNGAFTSPAHKISEKRYDLEEVNAIPSMVGEILDNIEEDITILLTSVNYNLDKFNDMILSIEKDNKVSTTLYTVALAYAKDYKTAIKVAKRGLKNHQSGGFIAGRTTYNEEVIDYCRWNLFKDFIKKIIRKG